MRAVSLARALDVRPTVALRGGRGARLTARRLGCRLVDAAPRLAIARHRTTVLVIDDPRADASRAWLRAARRAGVAVVGVRDRGIGIDGVDLAVDGSIVPGRDRVCDARTLRGPEFMMVDPAYARARRHRPRRNGAARRVAFALGGGHHARAGASFARRVVADGDGRQVRMARGLDQGSGGRTLEVLLDADVAVVSGGVSVFEACAVGVPTIAVAVTPAQRPTVRGLAARGAVIDGGALTLRDGRVAAPAAARVAWRVSRLLDDAELRRRLSRRAGQVVDGRGAIRVASAVCQLTDDVTQRARGNAS